MKLYILIAVLVVLSWVGEYFIIDAWKTSPPPAFSDTVFVASPPITVTVEKIVPKPVQFTVIDTNWQQAVAECPLYHPEVQAVEIDTTINKVSLLVGYTLPTPLQPLGIFDRIAVIAQPDTVKVLVPVYVKEGVGFWTVAGIAVGTAAVGTLVGTTLK